MLGIRKVVMYVEAQASIMRVAGDNSSSCAIEMFQTN